MDVIKVVIADDHKVVRQGLQAFLSLDAGIEIVGLAADGDEALELAIELQPDVLLLDLMMPHKDGFAVLHELRYKYKMSQLVVLVLTSLLDKASISQALKKGANGYLLKTVDAEELCNTIKVAASTKSILLTPEVSELLTNQEELGAGPTGGLSATSFQQKLTERELEILDLLSQGLANKEIAGRLYLSEGTVKTHVSIILSKLGIQSRTQAALQAAKLGLLNQDFSVA